MNTYRIYEDLRSALGEEAAKSLAHTLGPMFEELGNEKLGSAVTKAEFRELNKTVGRLADAQERTEDRVTRLAEAQERTEKRVAELAEGQASLVAAQTRTEAQVAELTKAQARTEAQVAELTKAQAHTEVRLAELSAAQTQTQLELAELTKVVRTLVVNGERQATRLDAVLGRTFELQFRDRLTAYLSRLMRRGKLLRNDEVLDSIEQAVDAREADEVLRADAIASGLIDGVASYVVVEVSVACGVDDIDRAERRAGILRKAGLPAVALVACEVISPELVAYARSKQVRIWCDGTVLDAAA
jgi:chromosome segregation ATPase